MSKKNTVCLLKEYNINSDLDNSRVEIGIDEVGRGPLFGRVYSASVVLPKKEDFKYEIIKDSKKFSSKKKMLEVYNYLIENLEYYCVSYVDEKYIDKNNILNASHQAMHMTINGLLEKHKSSINISNCLLMVDGNNFKPYCRYVNDGTQDGIVQIEHVTIEGGDNIYCNIAAASILAKVEHDKYIEELCKLYPKLHTLYDLNNNKGYGTRKHIEGIKKYGISPWHRVSFATCKGQPINPKEYYLDSEESPKTPVSNSDEPEDAVSTSKQTA